jgi:hypothetical protein
MAIAEADRIKSLNIRKELTASCPHYKSCYFWSIVCLLCFIFTIFTFKLYLIFGFFQTVISFIISFTK